MNCIWVIGEFGSLMILISCSKVCLFLSPLMSSSQSHHHGFLNQFLAIFMRNMMSNQRVEGSFCTNPIIAHCWWCNPIRFAWYSHNCGFIPPWFHTSPLWLVVIRSSYIIILLVIYSHPETPADQQVRCGEADRRVETHHWKQTQYLGDPSDPMRSLLIW